MDFMVNIDIKPLPKPLSYNDKILLIGSCFTEHIGNTLEELKFSVLQNPNGILFDPASVCKSLVSYTENREYTEKDLFYLNEVWNSWEHHSRFSHPDAAVCLQMMNEARWQAHDFLKKANWLIVTLGSSFSYRLTEHAAGKAGEGVANCHRAPAQWFSKHLLAIEETVTLLDNCYHQLKRFNPHLNILFTVSPVRHIRDGVVENNRSKARLIEAVHHTVNKFEGLHYFPAYELVIDVLRDYRFYDIDLVHPNYSATAFVLDKFAESCIDSASRQLMPEIKKIVIARKHKAFHPSTQAHRQFLAAHLEKVKALQHKYPFLDLAKEAAYFSQSN
ncbi:MAG: GSCFA domain-containing protein [Sphingobacteriales bacterium]|nr:GSCFA domain-containing protein [Sphingobacteriales bacterium]OJW03667.1 MAG: GSCFA domain-containing protein [Sphingobacteriales bacterium 44-61]